MTTRRQTQRERSSPPTVDVYARLSRAEDGSTFKVDDQVGVLTALIEERGGVLGKVHRDNNLSGWNPKVVRPSWNDMMARLRAGEADGVAVVVVDRFTRKVREGLDLLDIAKERGAVIWSDGGSYDLNTADGRSAFRDACNRAETESEKIAERITRGKRRKAMRGRSNASHRGFAMPGFAPNGPDWMPGDPRTPVPDEQVEAEREAVREVVRRLMLGATWDSLTRWLNEQGLRTYAGNEWGATSLRSMLRRPSLAGIAEHNGEEVGTLTGEPVLDRETWDRLQSVMDSRRRGRAPSERYLLTGLLTCSRCGRSLVGRPRTGRRPYEDGSVAREYWCQKRPGPRSGCGRLAIDQRWADEVVADMVQRRLANPAHAARLEKRAAKTQATRDRLEAEQDRLRTDAEALAEKVASWGLGRVERAMRPLDARLEAIAASLAALEAPEAPAEAWADAAEAWSRAEAAGDVATLRTLVRRALPGGILIRPATAYGKGARQDLSRFGWDGA